ncbi:MAG: exopolyphosphatase [Flavobacteriales bacterium]|nr:exopolyphosphatase [Flavobacteriales bacterium]
MNYLRFASIDIGSNAIRLLSSYVFETEEGPYFRKGLLVRVPVRLGEDAFRYGKIMKDKEYKLTETMLSFKHLMLAMDVHSYKAYATSAMRDASNGREIVEHVEEVSGIRIEIISGEKEASVISGTSVPQFIEDIPERVLFMDVGGGSTEFTLIGDQEMVSESFNIGTIRSLFHSIHSTEWKRLKKWLKSIGLLDSKIPILGSGGNINKIYKIKRANPLDYFITTGSLEQFYKDIKDLSYQERIVKHQLNPDRADVIQPACEIFLKVIEHVGSERIYVPKTGLSDGIVRDLYEDYLQQAEHIQYP